MTEVPTATGETDGTSTPVVRLENVTKHFGDFIAVEQADFEAMFADIPDTRADTHVTPVPLDGPIVRRAPGEQASGPAAAPKTAPQPA